MRQFNESIKKVVAAINSAPPEQYTFVCESAPKHDGVLDADGHLKVYLFKGPYASHIGIENCYRDTGDEEVLNPKQALSLLAWLRQEETTLEQLAKEQQDG